MQDMDGMRSSILTDCFSGNTFDANGTDNKSRGGGSILQFFMTNSDASFKNHYLEEAVLFIILALLLKVWGRMVQPEPRLGACEY